LGAVGGSVYHVKAVRGYSGRNVVLVVGVSATLDSDSFGRWRVVDNAHVCVNFWQEIAQDGPLGRPYQNGRTMPGGPF